MQAIALAVSCACVCVFVLLFLDHDVEVEEVSSGIPVHPLTPSEKLFPLDSCSSGPRFTDSGLWKLHNEHIGEHAHAWSLTPVSRASRDSGLAHCGFVWLSFESFLVENACYL